MDPTRLVAPLAEFLEPVVPGVRVFHVERIDGPLLGDSISKDGQLVEEAASGFVRLMVDLHNLDWRPFAVPLTGYQDVDPLAHSTDLLRSWRIEARQFVGFAAPATWLTEQLSRVAPEPPAVIHRDFHPWNVLIDPVRGARVIDWTGITVLDRRYDVAWSLLLAGAYLGDEARSRFETLYRQACRSPMGNLEYFDVLAATMRLHHMVVSLTSSPEGVGMRPAAADQMKEHVGAYRWIADLLADRTGLVIPEVEELLTRLS